MENLCFMRKIAVRLDPMPQDRLSLAKNIKNIIIFSEYEVTVHFYHSYLTLPQKSTIQI